MPPYKHLCKRALRRERHLYGCVAVNTSMSIDLRDEGVTSVLLHPGWVRTNMTRGEAVDYRSLRCSVHARAVCYAVMSRNHGARCLHNKLSA